MTVIEPSVPEPLAIIAAFVDGEQVDAAALKHELSTDDGRDYFVDVLALRQSAAGMGPVSYPTPINGSGRKVWRWMAAAAIALSASTAGYVAGWHVRAPMADATNQSRVEAVVDIALPALAPEPTDIVRLRPGVDWTVPGEN